MPNITAEERKNVLNYIVDVLEQDVDFANTLREEGLTTPRIILNAVNDGSIDQLGGNITIVQKEILRYFAGWMEWWLERQGHNDQRTIHLPSTLQEWQAAFTFDSFAEFSNLRSTVSSVRSSREGNDNSNQTENQNTNNGQSQNQNNSNPTDPTSRRNTNPNQNSNPPSNIEFENRDNQDSDTTGGDSEESIFSTDSEDEDNDTKKKKTYRSGFKMGMTDFPSFDGQMGSWPVYRRQMEASIGLLGSTSILKINTSQRLKRHKRRRKKNNKYNQRVIDLHAILTRKLAHGFASSHVEKYDETQDGALAWRALCKHYEHGGDSERRVTTIIQEIQSLQLRHDSHGGFLTYLDKFQRKTLELDKLKKPLDDAYKKIYFLQGITDWDYETAKTICNHKTYEETVDEIKSQAISIGKYGHKNGGGGGSRRQQSRKTRNGKGRHRGKSRNGKQRDPNRRNNNKRNSDGKGNGNESGNPPDSGFSNEVWSKMSQGNRKWIESRRKEDTPEYGKQYSGTPPRSQNNLNTDGEDENKDPNKKVSFKQDQDDKKGKPQSIFRRKHRMMKTSPDESEANENSNKQIQTTTQPTTPKNLVIYNIVEWSTTSPRRMQQGITNPGEQQYNIYCRDDQMNEYIYKVEEMKEINSALLATYVLENYRFSSSTLLMRDLIQWAIDYAVDNFEGNETNRLTTKAIEWIPEEDFYMKYDDDNLGMDGVRCERFLPRALGEEVPEHPDGIVDMQENSSFETVRFTFKKYYQDLDGWKYFVMDQADLKQYRPNMLAEYAIERINGVTCSGMGTNLLKWANEWMTKKTRVINMVKTARRKQDETARIQGSETSTTLDGGDKVKSDDASTDSLPPLESGNISSSDNDSDESDDPNYISDSDDSDNSPKRPLISRDLIVSSSEDDSDDDSDSSMNGNSDSDTTYNSDSDTTYNNMGDLISGTNDPDSDATPESDFDSTDNDSEYSDEGDEYDTDYESDDTPPGLVTPTVSDLDSDTEDEYQPPPLRRTDRPNKRWMDSDSDDETIHPTFTELRDIKMLLI